MPGQSPPPFPRAPLPASAPARSVFVPAGRIPASARSARSARALLAAIVLALLASPGVAGPAIGDSAPSPPARPRAARWVPDTPTPGGLLWIDKHLSPSAGAANLLFAHGALSRIENRLLPTRLFEEENRFDRLLSFSYRLGKLTFLDLPAAYCLYLLQHEVFGHGWRAREEGYGEHVRYEFQPPPPYGSGGGLTRYSFPEGADPGVDETLARVMAGIEAADILAQRQRNRFLGEGSLDYHGALAYLNSSLGLALYAGSTEGVETETGNDVSNWLLFVNWKADRDAASDPWVSLSELQLRSLLALADPFLWYAAWTAGRYLWNGSMRWRQPMVPLGPVRWLPSLGYRLSPFGGQYLAENLLALGPRTATLRAAWGGGDLGSSWGADAEAQDLVRWRGWSLDAALRAWSQPPLQLEWSAPRPPGDPRFGAGMSATAVSPALSRAFPLRLGAGFSTKRAGYVPGESLDADFALRVGVGWHR
jgi:hypothetical protein